MPKFLSLPAFAVMTVLLSGCTGISDGEPGAAPTVVSESASASPSATMPSDTVATFVATPTAASPGAPAVGSAAPETLEAVPSVPAVVPPVAVPGETAAVPMAPTVEADPEPATSAGVIVTPDPEYGVVSVTVAQGASFTIDCSGYEPGQQVLINFGIAQSDGMVMDEQSAIADAVGNYTFTITVGTDLDPGTYAVLTFPGAALGGPEFEASKRFAVVEVVAP